MAAPTLKIYLSAALENNENDQRLEKKLNDENSFINQINHMRKK